MGGGECGEAGKGGGIIGLALPTIDGGVGEQAGLKHRGKEGVVADKAAGEVEEDGAGLDAAGEGAGDEAARAVRACLVEGDMKGNDVGLREEFLDGDEVPSAEVAVILAGRVAAERPHAEGLLGETPDDGADMADTDDAEGGAGPVASLPLADGEQGGDDVIRDALGVAAGGGGDLDAKGAEGGKVDVVGAGNAAADEAHGRAFEQRGVEAAGGADEEEVAIHQVGMGEGAAVDGAGAAKAGEELGAEGEVAVVEDGEGFAHRRPRSCCGVRV